MPWIFISGQQRYLLLENVYMQRMQNNNYYLLEFLLTQSSSPSYLGGLGLGFLLLLFLLNFTENLKQKAVMGFCDLLNHNFDSFFRSFIFDTSVFSSRWTM